MFETILIQPIFNLLTLIYAIIPGHNLGVAIIVFTVLIRVLMWPLVRRQLHHAKAMRELQPELKKIRQQTKGNKQKESAMIMALYKEREINPFASLGILLLQLPILLALYSCLRRIINDPQTVIDFSYSFVRHLPAMKELATDVSGKFDSTLFGVIDLTRLALGSTGVYWPALTIAFGSAISQYYQSKQLTMTDENARSMRNIFRDTASGKQVDQAEVNAAMGRNMRLIIPVLMLALTVHIASGLALYLFVSGLVAYAQQAYILGKDKDELLAIEAEVGEKPTKAELISATKAKNNKSKKGGTTKQRKQAKRKR